ncbi:uncharacterized protein LOC120151055 [Hibiscus syriacus]|uniref:uncharacterized protein LOC120151055 n=1 Tax=Hibiscus syriacus TaxID=106335 RepID=UPI001923AEDD|nr:uncharacterized protein LOC120151055 [Hibiscus syriacus]
MAAPTTPTTVQLVNDSGDTLTLVSSTYGGVSNVIKSGESVVFEQNTSLNTFGSAVYTIGKIAIWIVVWTANNQVATSILPAGTPAIWEDIWNKIQPDRADYSYLSSYGWLYRSQVDIKSDGDAQTLSALLMSSDPN